MNYGKINTHDIANGPGVRVSLFVSGCRNHCPGCFNPETWDFNYGKPFTFKTLDNLVMAVEQPHIAGLSVLGGEPLEKENVECLTDVCSLLKQRCPEKTIWLYTGRLWESVRQFDIMKYLDVLVDGPFLEDRKNIRLKFRGSENQRVIDVPASLKSGFIKLYDLGE